MTNTLTIGIIGLGIIYSIAKNIKQKHEYKMDDMCTNEYNKFMKSYKYLDISKQYEKKVNLYLKEYYLCVKHKIG